MENINGLFVYISMKAKFQFVILEKAQARIHRKLMTTIKSTSSVTPLGINTDSKMNFKEHIDNIIQKAYYKVYA